MRAEKILLEALKQWDFDSDVFEALFDLFIDMGRTTDACHLFENWSHHLVEVARLRLLTNLYEAKGDFAKAIATVKERERKSGTPNKTDEIFLNLCAKNFSEAERLARDELTRYNFSPEAVAETVNYELARKAQSKKPDVNRLEAVLKLSSDLPTKAAICWLLGRKGEVLKALKEEYAHDHRVRFTFKRWPVFAELQTDKDFSFLMG